MLVLCLGPATRLSEFLSSASKRYEAVIRFGTSTETYDAEGDAVRITGAAPTEEEIRSILPDFTGEIEQTPPPYSAIKIQGKKAYELARKGENVELDPRTITIYNLDLIDYTAPDLMLTIECSAGTYIRSLAHDLGEQLNTGAHLANLRRVKSGPFTIDECVSLSQLELSISSGDWGQYVRPAVEALPELPTVKLADAALEDIRNGRRIPAEGQVEGLARAIGPDGDLVAILEAAPEGGFWHPKKVFGR
ncbi:MAG: tRNA pseudouridine(55) synthase TruB [Anaerolineales bacterium]|nr:MAG: tRNA pseudouridine(55) synthase TruB [Anaerolineales bacterium]